MTTFAEAFRTAQASAFAFLSTDHGFGEGEIEVGKGRLPRQLGKVIYRDASPRLRYRQRARRVTLTLYEGNGDTTFFISYGREDFCIFELCKLEGCSMPQSLPAKKMDLDADALRANFNWLAQMLRECGDRFFSGDQTLWNDVRKKANDDRIAWGDQVATRDAEEAYRDANWNEVIRLLHPRSSRISTLQAARLKYARRKQAEGGA